MPSQRSESHLYIVNSLNVPTDHTVKPSCADYYFGCFVTHDIDHGMIEAACNEWFRNTDTTLATKKTSNGTKEFPKPSLSRTEQSGKTPKHKHKGRKPQTKALGPRDITEDFASYYEQQGNLPPPAAQSPAAPAESVETTKPKSKKRRAKKQPPPPLPPKQTADELPTAPVESRLYPFDRISQVHFATQGKRMKTHNTLLSNAIDKCARALFDSGFSSSKKLKAVVSVAVDPDERKDAQFAKKTALVPGATFERSPTQPFLEFKGGCKDTNKHNPKSLPSLVLLLDNHEHVLISYFGQYPWVRVGELGLADAVIAFISDEGKYVPLLMCERKRVDDLMNGLGKTYKDQRIRLANLDVPAHCIAYILEELEAVEKPQSFYTAVEQVKASIGRCRQVIAENGPTIDPAMFDALLKDSLRQITSMSQECIEDSAWRYADPVRKSRKKRGAPAINDATLFNTCARSMIRDRFRWLRTGSTLETGLLLLQTMRAFTEFGFADFLPHSVATTPTNPGQKQAQDHAHPDQRLVDRHWEALNNPSNKATRSHADSPPTPTRKEHTKGKRKPQEHPSPTKARRKKLKFEDGYCPDPPRIPSEMRTADGKFDETKTLCWMLMCIPGVGYKVASALHNHYLKMDNLVAGIMENPKEKRPLALAKIPLDPGSKRAVGKTMSRKIYSFIYLGKQMPKGAFEVPNPSRPQDFVTGTNILKRMMLCVRGIGNVAAQSICNNFDSMRKLVAHIAKERVLVEYGLTESSEPCDFPAKSVVRFETQGFRFLENYPLKENKLLKHKLASIIRETLTSHEE